MNEAARSDSLDPRRRRALFRSWHRGTREMDLILGPFADAQLGGLTADELAQYEALLEQPDTDFYQWITGEKPAPPEVDGELFQRIRAFARSR
jgi:antitoxin CptB